MTPCFAEATHGHTSYGTDAHVHVGGTAWPWQRTARCALLLSMLTTDFQAHAIEVQGATLQGATLQGATLQGRTLHGAGLRLTQLSGMREHTDGSPVRIDIVGFRGDRVLVRMQVPGAQSLQEIEIHVAELIGMTWAADACDGAGTCQTVAYRIENAVQDDSTNTMVAHSDNSDVWLYEIEHALIGDAGPVAWMPVCGGERNAGLFVDGLWHEDGSREDAGYTFSCLDGVIAKCVRGWGYKPWKTQLSEAHGAVELADLHQTCTRAARADYCGDGTPHTRDGTLIDIFDGHGFNVRDESLPFAPEAGFDTNGARWVQRPRWPTGEEIADAPEGGWRFSTCDRPASDPTFVDEPARLEVWSNPLLGR